MLFWHEVDIKFLVNNCIFFVSHRRAHFDFHSKINFKSSFSDFCRKIEVILQELSKLQHAKIVYLFKSYLFM